MYPDVDTSIGDIVRVAPNEIVFAATQAAIGESALFHIYTSFSR